MIFKIERVLETRVTYEKLNSLRKAFEAEELHQNSLVSVKVRARYH